MLSPEAKEARRQYRRERTRDYMREYMRNWRKKNPEKVKAIEERYWERVAARMQANEESHCEG